LDFGLSCLYRPATRPVGELRSSRSVESISSFGFRIQDLIHHLEDLHLLGLAFDLGGGELPDLELRSQPFPGGAGGQDLTAFGQTGKAGSRVDRVGN
jgi:hypothetical protein